METHVDNQYEISKLEKEIGDIATQINALRAKLADKLYRKNILEHDQSKTTSSVGQVDCRIQKIN